MTAWLGRTRHVHFVGIGGIGMSGIAELLRNLGYEVSGSDVRRSDVTDRLARLGVRVAIGHDAGNVGEADVVVVSSAIPRANPEIAHARMRHVPVIPRAEMLAELMRLRFGIAVAGAHGKTTTTSMLALTLERAGLDPTAVIGGRLSAFGGNARLGRGEYMVAEADESDRSFLKLSPSIAVITNIDREHLDSYGSFERLEDAFADFAGRVPFYGAVVACVDDPPVAALLPRLDRRTITYGFSVAADVRGLAPVSDGRSARCGVHYAIRGVPGGTGEGDIALRVPGLHNLQNALAVVAVALDLGVPFGRIAPALAEFTGAERRYETRGFQPHRYTRTRDLMAEFGPALASADIVVLTGIYPAGEAPIAGATLDALAAAMRPHLSNLQIVPELADVPARVAAMAREGDLVLTLGAGSIGGVGDRILAELNGRAA
jgi:UDP-N-acetylmuramate--alanine ligase